MKKIIVITLTGLLLVVSCNKESKNKTEDKKVTTQNSTKSEAETKIRKLASNDGQLILDINDKIINIKNKNEIIPLINSLNEMASKNPNNYTLQLYTAVLTPLKHLEGIVWRFRDIIEESQVAHLSALGAIRNLYYIDYMYGPHVKAVINFLIEPNVNERKFQNMAEAQDYIFSIVRPEVETSLDTVIRVQKETPTDWEFAFDAYVLSGFDAESGKKFLSDSKRYQRKVTKSHLNFVTSAMHRFIGGVKYMVNYNVNDISEFSNDLVRATSLNNLLRTKPVPMTPKESYKIISRRTYKKFLTLRTDSETALVNIKESLFHFSEATKYDLAAITSIYETSDLAMADTYMLDPHFVHVNYTENVQTLNEKIELYKDALAGKESIITSEVTGKQIKVNISSLFKPYQDLKSFLPTKKGFYGDKTGKKLKKANGKTLRHNKTKKSIFAWDYSYGKPTQWQDPTFAGFLPEATNENIYQLARDLKLTDSINGFFDILPLP